MSIIYGNTTPTYMQIVPKWSSIVKTIIKAGTPLAADGSIANNANAIGILPNTVGKTDPADAVNLIVAGVLSLPAVESESGLTIENSCKVALDQITFIKEDGTVDVASPLPEITDADDGKVLTAESGEWVAKESSSGGGFGCIVIGIDDEDKTGFHYIVGSYADALHGAFCVLVADYYNAGGTDDYVMAKYRNTDGESHVSYRFEDDQEDGFYGVYELMLRADGTIEERGRPS